MPRPSKLSLETQERICAVLRAGNLIEVSAQAAGISSSTFRYWMQRGRREGRNEARYRGFRAAVEQAQADAEASLVARTTQMANQGSWRAATWLLERRHPEHWAPVSERMRLADTDERSEQVDPLERFDELASRRSTKR